MHRHQLRLLAVAPLPALDEDDEDEESASFNATAHINFFEKTLELYGVEYDKWVPCHCADSAAVNKKIATDTHGNHGSCGSHCIGLAGKEMVEEDSELKDIVETISAVSRHVCNSAKVKTSLRNAAAATNPHHATIAAKTESTTRQWIGAAVQVNQQIKLVPYYETLIKNNVGKMREHQKSVLPEFIDNCKSHGKVLDKIREVSVRLQKHGMILNDSQGWLDYLVPKVEKHKRQGGKLFSDCKLGTHYLKPDNGLNTNPAFITGVMKIQQGLPFENLMTSAERLACKCLLKDTEGNVSDVVDTSDDNSDDMEKDHRNQKKRKCDAVAGESKYVNCHFILGSAAVVESLWSEEDALMTPRRRSMAPITNELILFLKKNEDLWTITDVSLANEDRKKSNRTQRLAKRMAEEKEHDDLVGGVIGNLGGMGL